ncbi:hydrolase [Gluconacetobacter sacchari]|uniref:Hydrolase n=2 Tax=Gluconacetobacter sacchari TaxID=92759 RepID=A0A7W4NLX0_9PROT|nr:hydrolase [Gluconacetobacter sacchari]MBB2160229.1 hydrolase [Gluconacetobacter sacchari]GBQ28584.1 isochorismatase hydrolase [Gluconacetobacter sacchari DSM 12717]
MLQCDPRTTALVLIDLQNGILALPTVPRPSSEVLEGGKSLAKRFRDAGAAVVLVRVAFAPDYADAPPGSTDQPLARPEGGLPANWARLADGLEAPGDIVITKHQWGAFTGTELDLQLRRRGVRTIVLGGIATNFGVESTARHAWELGYHVVIAEDLCTSLSAELHDIAVRSVFPRIARVTRADGISISH